MTNSVNHSLIQRYMKCFDEEAKVILSSRRIVLRAEILSHLSELLPADATADAVSAALDELGPPVDIVSQEIEMNPVPVTTNSASKTGRIILAVIAALVLIKLAFVALPLVQALVVSIPPELLVGCSVIVMIGVTVLISMRVRRGLRRRTGSGQRYLAASSPAQASE